jgi:hypothetical protein
MLLLSSGFSNTAGSYQNNQSRDPAAPPLNNFSFFQTHLVAKLQETLQTGAAVLRPLAFEAVRQQKDNAVLALKAKDKARVRLHVKRVT